MKKGIACLVLAGITGATFAQGRISIQLGNLSKVVNEENGVALFSPEAKVKLIVYDQEILRVNISRDKSAYDLTDAMMNRDGGKLTKIAENTKEIFYSTGKINVSVSKIAPRLNFMSAFSKSLNHSSSASVLSWTDPTRTNYRKLFSDAPESRFHTSLTDGGDWLKYRLASDSLPDIFRNDVGFTGKSNLQSAWNLGYPQSRIALKNGFR